MKISLLNRSVFLYGLAVILLMGLANVKVTQRQRAAYLAGMLTKGAKGSEKDRTAVLYFDTLTQIAPRDADSYVNLAVCYYRLGQESQAVAAYNKAVKLGADPSKIIPK